MVERRPVRHAIWSSSSQGGTKHRHGAAALIVKEGRGLVRGGENAGPSRGRRLLHRPPNSTGMERTETRMAHFAVNLTLTTEWLEPVSDDQYRAS